MLNTTALSHRQARFVQEYLIDGVGSQAAIRAGVAPSGAHVWASRVLRIAKVSAALKAHQAADAARLSLEREDVLAGLMESIDQAKAQSNPASMISGWREIAKMMGYYAPEVKEVRLSDKQSDIQTEMAALSDAELIALIERGASSAHPL